MPSWALPERAELAHGTYEIRSDFRAVLDILSVMGDPGIDAWERSYVAMRIFYPGLDAMDPRDREDAAAFMSWFVDGGQPRERKKQPRLMDWEKDFPLIVAPVNRVLGFESRAVPYDYETNEGGLHWWTFLGAYMEIGECMFANVVATRRKKAQGKMDKADRDFYRRNRDLVDLRPEPSEAERALVDEWIV